MVAQIGHLETRTIETQTIITMETGDIKDEEIITKIT